MVNRWLFKEEPSHYSYENLVSDKVTPWDGVTNNLALKHLRGAHKGDFFFFYHTGNEKAIVGVGQLTSDPYPNPDSDNPRHVVVDVKPVRRLKNPVTLAAIKGDAAFEGFALVRISRLSVMPVTEDHWKKIEKMSQ